MEVWNGLLYPRGTPPALVAAANAALRATLREPETTRKLAELGASAPRDAENTSEAFQALIVRENARWESVLRRLR